MSDNESDGEYSERINEMYERERDALKAYLDMMDNTEKDSSPDEIEETQPQTYAHYPGVDRSGAKAHAYFTGISQQPVGAICGIYCTLFWLRPYSTNEYRR